MTMKETDNQHSPSSVHWPINLPKCWHLQPSTFYTTPLVHWCWIEHFYNVVVRFANKYWRIWFGMNINRSITIQIVYYAQSYVRHGDPYGSAKQKYFLLASSAAICWQRNWLCWLSLRISCSHSTLPRRFVDGREHVESPCPTWYVIMQSNWNPVCLLELVSKRWITIVQLRRGGSLRMSYFDRQGMSATCDCFPNVSSPSNPSVNSFGLSKKWSSTSWSFLPGFCTNKVIYTCHWGYVEWHSCSIFTTESILNMNSRVPSLITIWSFSWTVAPNRVF